MRFKNLFVLSLVLMLSGLGFAGSDLSGLSKQAVSADPSESTEALKLLRHQKQAGLNALFDTYSTEIAQYKAGNGQNADWERISAAIDAVAMQKDAYSSRLYWHTDIEEAKRESLANGKPILSLRLLGNLNEEYSCANSRFFRAILYSDPAIAETLREKYVLHWQSVRAAPKITIDYGDGRKLVRTITGNSIHYVLDSSGNIIDGLPGLYDPIVFRRYLERLSNLNKSAAGNPRLIVNYRTQTAYSLIGAWEYRLAALGKSIPVSEPAPSGVEGGTVLAFEAAPIAVTKMAVELPSVAALSRISDTMGTLTGLEDWESLADTNAKVRISPESIAFIRRQLPDTPKDEFQRLIENTQKYIALDTVQNEYRFHTKILMWLNPENASNVKQFNERVYTELFLTPESDKWFGLYTPDIYSAIKDNGIVESRAGR